ncbi:hypothetical protein [Bacteriophage Eos]|nr:hypothetical protein [Bacteriophage Eos]
MFIPNEKSSPFPVSRVREISTTDVTLNRQEVTLALTMAGWKWIFRFKSLEYYGQFETIIQTIKNHGNGRIVLAKFLPDLVTVADLREVKMDSTASLSEMMNVRPNKPFNEVNLPWQNRDGWLTNKSPRIGDSHPPIFTITSSTEGTDNEIRALVKRVLESNITSKQ